MARNEVLIVIGVLAFSALIAAVISVAVKASGPHVSRTDVSTTIMNIRNCQQAMRGEQNMKSLNVGDPFTRRDLEQYMQFPENIPVSEGLVVFTPGTEITPVGTLWLQVSAPGTVNHVGTYGFESADEFQDW